MATPTQESLEERLEPMKHKKWVLKVSIHCEGCKKRFRKILSQVPGVHEMEFDIRQQQVTVTGDVAADALIRRLKKSGKKAQLLPENFPDDDREKKEGKLKEREKGQPHQESNEQTSRNAAAIGDHEKEASKAVALPPKVKSERPQEPPENSQVDGVNGTAGGSAGAAPKSTSGESGPKATSGDTKASNDEKVAKVTPGDTKGNGDEKEAEEPKTEGKEPEASSPGGQPPTEAEKKGGDRENGDEGGDGGGGKVESGNISNNKNKEGQDGKNDVPHPSLIAASADTGLNNDDEIGPQAAFVTANHVDPRQHVYYNYQSNFYEAPTVQAVSYNMAYPGSRYPTSYYAAPPPNSHMHPYYGPMAEPPPSDMIESYPRGPLDSFEMFSDENPNGCVII